jgi:hypothetical protein
MGTVLRVGRGCGFVIEADGTSYVVTAAHCLPARPGPSWSPEECIYTNLLGRLDAKPRVTAECVFSDPVADIAVLGEPDGKDTEAYRQLMATTMPFAIGQLKYRPSRFRLSDGITASSPREVIAYAMLLSLDGRWFSCRVRSLRSLVPSLVIEYPAQPIVQELSGSPIILADGSAIGVVCTKSGGDSALNPLLPACLPAWLAALISSGRRGPETQYKKPVRQEACGVPHRRGGADPPDWLVVADQRVSVPRRAR